MKNQRIFNEEEFTTDDWVARDIPLFGKDRTLADKSIWPKDYDFVIRTAGGGRKLTGNHLGAVWIKGEEPSLNMGITFIKANVEGVYERFQQIDPEEIMWFTLHPFMSIKDITRWYVKKFK